MKALVRLLEKSLARLTYHEHKTGEVVSSHGDSFDVRLDDGASLERVTAWHGLPASSEVEPGTKCLVAFAGGDPARPYIAAWGSGEIRRLSLGDGDRPVARIGDTVQMLIPPGMDVAGIPVAGVVQGVVVPPLPAPPFPLPPTPFTGTLTPLPPLRLAGKGTIQGGNHKLRA